MTSKRKNKNIKLTIKKLLVSPFWLAIMGVVCLCVAAAVFYPPFMQKGYAAATSEPFYTAGETDTVNINTAPLEELAALPGIGEKRAQDIIAYREENDGFSGVEELDDVKGIGKATLEKLLPMICVE